MRFRFAGAWLGALALMACALVALAPPFATAQAPAYGVSSIVVSYDSNTAVANATVPLLVGAYAGGGTVKSVSYYTGGTSTPSFTAAIQIGGVNVTGCSSIAVSSSTAATTTCTGANTFASGASLTLVVTGVSGSPSQALVQVNYTSTLN